MACGSYKTRWWSGLINRMPTRREQRASNPADARGNGLARMPLAWLAAVILPLAVDCAACTWPAILGRNDPDTLQHPCEGAPPCPAGFTCPAPFSGGRCEYHSEIQEMGAAARDGG